MSDKNVIEYCPKCHEPMEITIWPSQYSDGIFFRKAECKTHGRTFGRYQEATEAVQEASEIEPESGGLDLTGSDKVLQFSSLCNRCKLRKNGRVYANNEYNLVCEDCHETLKEQGMSDAAIRQHMTDILSGD